MKIRVTMKNPDTLHDAIADAAKEFIDSLAYAEKFDEEEKAHLIESRKERWAAIAKKWFQYGEYLTVEIDADAETCVVIPN